MSNGLDDMIEEDRRIYLKEEDKNQKLEFENQALKKQLALLQQQMEEKERTIRLLQQQMVGSRFLFRSLSIFFDLLTSSRITSKFLNSLNRPHCRRLRAPAVGLFDGYLYALILRRTFVWPNERLVSWLVNLVSSEFYSFLISFRLINVNFLMRTRDRSK